jgi:putative holliday junction resolvase
VSVSIMALDVGSKRIGVAVADPTGTFALPVGTIERSTLNEDLRQIAGYVESYLVSDLVVGDPISLSGERGIAAQKMDGFVERLRVVFSGVIHRVDERMTTAQVTRSLIDGGAKRKDRKRVVDQLAAALILDSFLARRRRPS